MFETLPTDGRHLGIPEPLARTLHRGEWDPSWPADFLALLHVPEHGWRMIEITSTVTGECFARLCACEAPRDEGYPWPGGLGAMKDPAAYPVEAMAMVIAQHEAYWWPFAGGGFPAEEFLCQCLKGAPEGHVKVDRMDVLEWQSLRREPFPPPGEETENCHDEYDDERPEPGLGPPFPAPAHGFRAWVERAGNLVPLSGAEPWRAEGFSVAAHVRDCARGGGEPPCVTGCGFHAFSTLGLAVEALGCELLETLPRSSRYWDKPEPLVLGAVLGCGRLAVHHDGFRSSHARPLALLDPFSLGEFRASNPCLDAAFRWLVPNGELDRMAAATAAASRGNGLPVLGPAALLSWAAEHGDAIASSV